MLGEPKGIPHYPCPMCGTPVYSSAFQCPSCGTDLTRAGAVFSSSGTSAVEWKRTRRSTVWVALVAVTALGVAAGTVGRPWVQEFVAPGIVVMKVAAERTFRSVQHSLSRLPERLRSSPGTRPAAKVSPASVPASVKPSPPAAVKSAAFAPVVPAPAASLSISSSPRGARVQIDGVARGVTPVTISQLRAGAYKVRISHEGYRPVTRTVTLEPGKKVSLGVSLPAQAPPKVATPSPKPAPVRVQATTPLEVGRLAPQFVAKDRIGVLYRTTDYRGRKLLLVFVQNLDGNAQRIIRELNALHTGGARGAAVVVVLRPDRASIRQFTQAEQIQIPVLFGTQTVARAYGVSSQPAVLYLVSEEGRVVLRQVGRVNPGAVLN